MPQRLVEGVAHVERSDMAIARPSQVIGLYVVSPDRSVDNTSYWRGAHEKPVVIKMQAAIIAVVVEAELGGISLGQKILHVNVGNTDFLSPILQRVEPTVGVLLEKVEPA